MIERVMEWLVFLGLWIVGAFCVMGLVGAAIRVWMEVANQ